MFTWLRQYTIGSSLKTISPTSMSLKMEKNALNSFIEKHLNMIDLKWEEHLTVIQ
jgi:hypothetical protein